MYVGITYEDFGKIRDRYYVKGVNCLSYKASQFRDVEEAKRFVQASRDEEGEHHMWPEVMPIYYGESYYWTSEEE